MLNRFNKNFSGPRTVPANISGNRIFAAGWSATGLAIMVACAFGSFVVSGGSVQGITLAVFFLLAAPVFAGIMGVAGNYVGRWRDTVAAQEFSAFQKTQALKEAAQYRCQLDLEKVEYLAVYFVPRFKETKRNLAFLIIDQQIGDLSEDGELYALVFKRALLHHRGELSEMHNKLINQQMKPLVKAKKQRLMAELKIDEVDIEKGVMYQELQEAMESLCFNDQLNLVADKAQDLAQEVASSDSLQRQFRYYFYDRELPWLEDNLFNKNEVGAFLPEADLGEEETPNKLPRASASHPSFNRSIGGGAMLFSPLAKQEPPEGLTEEEPKSKKGKEKSTKLTP